MSKYIEIIKSKSVLNICAATFFLFGLVFGIVSIFIIPKLFNPIYYNSVEILHKTNFSLNIFNWNIKIEYFFITVLFVFLYAIVDIIIAYRIYKRIPLGKLSFLLYLWYFIIIQIFLIPFLLIIIVFTLSDGSITLGSDFFVLFIIFFAIILGLTRFILIHNKLMEDYE